MSKKNALGRGLGALIDGVEKEVLERKVEGNNQVSIDLIDGNPFQPRSRFDEKALEELASSIKQELFNLLRSESQQMEDISLLQEKEGSGLHELPDLHMFLHLYGQPTTRLCLNWPLLKIFSAKTLMLLKLQSPTSV
jgi:hypothetical protein